MGELVLCNHRTHIVRTYVSHSYLSVSLLVPENTRVAVRTAQ